MATMISAYQITREYPTGARNEWRGVTEYRMADPANSIEVAYVTSIRPVTIELIGQNTRSNGTEILVDLGGGFYQGHTAMSLQDAIEQGHARPVSA